MREVNGVKVRSLTRKEIRGLKKYGFYFSFYSPPILNMDMIDEGIEKVMDLCVLDPEALKTLEEQSHNKTMEVFGAIVKETYGAKDEEKNLPTSGDGSQTDGE